MKKIQSTTDYRYFNGNLWNFEVNSISKMGWVFTGIKYRNENFDKPNKN
jgi:hypothetical protein